MKLKFLKYVLNNVSCYTLNLSCIITAMLYEKSRNMQNNFFCKWLFVIFHTLSFPLCVLTIQKVQNINVASKNTTNKFITYPYDIIKKDDSLFKFLLFHTFMNYTLLVSERENTLIVIFLMLFNLQIVYILLVYKWWNDPL